MEITVIELLKQMGVAGASILLGTQTITAAIHGAFKIENKNVVHAVSWAVAVLAAIGFVAFNGLDFGLPTVWNYVTAAVLGVFVGGASNGFYDWPWIESIFDVITRLFGKTKSK